MSLEDIPLTLIDGTPTTLGAYRDKVKLIVNVASRCGLTPQYSALEDLQRTYGERGFTVLGFPSNQFMQEMGSEESIATFCSTTYGVTFPMFEKVKVNGRSQHPLYAELTKTADDSGKAGRVEWNFGKVPDRAGRHHRAVPPPHRAGRPGDRLAHRGPAAGVTGRVLAAPAADCRCANSRPVVSSTERTPPDANPAACSTGRPPAR